ncbi:hypothetical protein VTN77DRAFT_8602 [Rasamsonia byssochlamydoides]|uniref:uncharacterized protein n=1 Tax=Rasamsonia byssochlamydoides TaxID=89139 RepID=UPI003742C38D
MASVPSSKPPLVKSHVCSYPNCGKSFTRAEHLRRHALNHTQDDNCCERCGVHFTRPDLLGRHMIRHAKRDKEAGGPGLGVLETRKRTRRGPDGRIVTRPTKKQARAAAAAASSSSYAGVSSIESTQSSCGSISASSKGPRLETEFLTTPGTSCGSGIHEDPRDYTPRGAPVSPPRSTHDSNSSVNVDALAESCDIVTASEPLLAPMVPGGPYEPYVEPIPGQFDAADGSWQTWSGLDYNDFFNLDTATSFNMPFAATLNYNWLFDVSSLDDAFTHVNIPLTTDLTNFAEPVSEMFSQPFLSGENSSQSPPSSAPAEPVLANLPSDGQSSSTMLEGQMMKDAGDMQPAICFSNGSEPENTSLLDNDSREPDFSDMDWMGPSKSGNVYACLPQITENARAGVLQLVSKSSPITPEGMQIDLSSSLLTLPRLQSYCDLFFTRFNTAYPLIHQATFDPDKVDSIFLAAVLCMGATYSSREAHQLAVRIHDTLRNHLFAHAAFSALPELWLLQTMLLIDCFGKQRAGQKQRDMAQLFHCVLIKLIRRSDCPTIRTSGISKRPDDLEAAWRRAMDAEQRKRLAMHCFMWDTQHAVLFSQSLCMSAFEIRSSLPCDPGSWEATSAEEWFENSRREGPHRLFLSVLKAYITPSAVLRPRHLNALARTFVLHGLLSVSSDLKRRDQTTLRSETPDLVGAWKTRIARSYDLWKADFDADCMVMKLEQRVDLREFTGLKTTTSVLYHAAHITLNVEILDLQIYAGAPHILGRVVTATDFERSHRNVTRWVNEDPRSASKAARHASSILQDAIMNLNDWDDTDVFYYSWCLYLATLTCWAFHLPASSERIALDGEAERNGNPHHSSGNNHVSSNAKNEMTSMLIAMTTCSSLEELSSLVGRFNTEGLTSIMAKQLAAVRWAVVHDAMKVLHQLAVR